MSESFLTKKQGGRAKAPTLGTFSGRKVNVDSQLSTPVEADPIIEKEVAEAIASIKQRAVNEMVAQMKSVGLDIDDDSINAAIQQYEKDPAIKAESREAVRKMSASLAGKKPEEIAEILARDAQAVYEANTSGTEIPLNNVLIPLLVSQGQLEGAALKEATEKNIGKLKLSTRYLKTGAVGATKRAIGKMAVPSAVVLHTTLAVVDTAVIEKAAEGVLSDWAIEGVTKDALAWGFSAAGNALLVKQKLGVRGEWIRGTADFFWSDKNRGRVYGALAASFLAAATPAILGNVKRGTVDAAVSGQVGKEMKSRYEPEVKTIRDTIALAKGLFSKIQPSIDEKMISAFKSGGIGWGRRTWSINRALYGKNAESDKNYDAFKLNPNAAATFRGKPMSDFSGISVDNSEQIANATTAVEAAQKELDTLLQAPRGKNKAARAKQKADKQAAQLKLDNAKKALDDIQKGVQTEVVADATPGPDPEMIEKAIAEINNRYGLNPTDGAEQYLKKLTADLEKVDSEKVFASLDSLIKESDMLANSGIIGNIFGILAPVPGIVGKVGSNVVQGEGLQSFTKDVPWDEMLHSSSGVRAIFRSEERYLAQRKQMVEELKKIQVTVQLQQYLTEVAQATGLNTNMNIPATSFNIEANVAGVDRAPYALMIDKSVMDYVLPLMPPDDSKEWEYIAKSFKNSGIDWIDVTTAAGKREAMGVLVGFVLLILAGSVFWTIGMKKLSKRWGVQGALRDDERKGLFAAETKIAQDMVNLVRKREDMIMTAIAKSGSDLKLPMRDDIALGAILQKQLREEVLAQMTPPLNETPEGIAFINRTSPLPTKELRNAYAAKLNEYIDRYKNDPAGAIATILDDIDAGRNEELAALSEFINKTAPMANSESAKQSIAAWWQRIDSKFVQEEIAARSADIQNMYAEREALLKMRPSVKIPLTANVTPNSIAPADIVHMARLSELDQLIDVQHAAINRISDGSISGRLARDTGVVLSDEQQQELSNELQNDELSNQIDQTDITEIAREYSALAESLGKRIGSLEGFVGAAFGEQAAGGRISFDYAYNPDLKGPSIVINLERADGETLTMPFRQIVPNRVLSSDESIINAAAQWLRPDSAEMRLMRLYAVHDSYKAASDEMQSELITSATNGRIDIATASDDQIATIQDLLPRKDIQRVQKQLIEQAKNSNEALNKVQLRVFEEPEKVSLGGVWKGDVRSLFKAATDQFPGVQVSYDVNTDEIVIPSQTGERRINIRNVK